MPCLRASGQLRPVLLRHAGADVDRAVGHQRGERRAARLHQAARAHRDAADASGDRRTDLCVLGIESRRFQLGAGGAGACARRLQHQLRIVEFLAADVARLHQRGQALELLLRLGHFGAGAGQRGLALRDAGLRRARIEAEQQLPGPHRIAFLHMLAQQRAAGLGHDGDLLRRFQRAGQVDHARKVAHRHRHGPDAQRLVAAALLVVAGVGVVNAIGHAGDQCRHDDE